MIPLYSEPLAVRTNDMYFFHWQWHLVTYCAIEANAKCQLLPASHRVLGRDPLAISAARDFSDPASVCKIPFNSATKPGLQGLPWTPSQFPFNLGGVDGISAIMPGSVLYKTDQVSVRYDWVVRP